MIPADGSHYVHYDPSSNGRRARRVVAWDDNGTPLVAGRHGLVPAHDLGTVKGIREGDAPVVGAVPGGGWMIECKDDEGNTWTSPILAWSIHADSSATPITSDSDGVATDATEGLAEYRVYHADSTNVSGPSNG